MKRSYEDQVPEPSCSLQSTFDDGMASVIGIQVQPDVGTQTPKFGLDIWTQTAKMIDPEATTSPTSPNVDNRVDSLMALDNDENVLRIVDSTVDNLEPNELEPQQLSIVRRNPPRKAKTNLKSSYAVDEDTSDSASESSDENEIMQQPFALCSKILINIKKLQPVLNPSPQEPVPNPSPQEPIPNPSPQAPIPNPSPQEPVPNPSSQEPVPNPWPQEPIPNPSPQAPVPNQWLQEPIPNPSPQAPVPDPWPQAPVPNQSPQDPIPNTSPQEPEVVEQMDENMVALKPLVMKWNRKTDIELMIGVHALQHHVQTMNDRFEGPISSVNLYSSELHTNNAAKLNLALCSFLREYRTNDNGAIAADVLYYMLLGIQQYLQQMGRTDNIFFDDNYQELHDQFDMLVSQHETPSNNYSSLITESFLWKTKQLGNHSGRGLLFTLLYFNTKFFRLNTIEKHMRLTLGAVQKYWECYAEIRGDKSSPINAAITPNRNNIEVFYKTYFSACPPNSGGSCTFYLTPLNNIASNAALQYSTEPFSVRSLQGMLNTVKMVQEVIFYNATPLINSDN